MRYGITGNTTKDNLWEPAAGLIRWLEAHDLPYCLHADLAEGLAARDLLPGDLCATHSEADLSDAADLVLSFGGDGTLLNTAYEIGPRGVPILGINIGRLGFLADIEVEQLTDTITCLEAGEYRIEERMVLEARGSDGSAHAPLWALNEFVLERSGAAGMLAIEVHVDDVPLNTYWADGLIVSTPTGSTAYSLSVGGPILVPGCGTLILTPIAPHTLTARPIVLPASVQLSVRVVSHRSPFVFAADGRSTVYEHESPSFIIERATHTVNLVKLPKQHFFQTLHSKLMWGMRRHGEGRSIP